METFLRLLFFVLYMLLMMMSYQVNSFFFYFCNVNIFNVFIHCILLEGRSRLINKKLVEID